MFDVGASELLMIVIVAVVVIGPKDMPMALRMIPTPIPGAASPTRRVASPTASQ